MLRNRIIDIKVETADVVVEEPVSLEDAKIFLKIGFDDDNTLIQRLITASRELLENQLNLSIVKKNVQLLFSHDGCNLYPLAFGPIGTITEAKFSYNYPDDLTITTDNYKIVGLEFKSFKGSAGYWTLTYDAGYTDTPQAICQGILKQVAWMYENRGDMTSVGTINPDVLYLLSAYNKNTWI